MILDFRYSDSPPRGPIILEDLLEQNTSAKVELSFFKMLTGFGNMKQPRSYSKNPSSQFDLELSSVK